MSTPPPPIPWTKGQHETYSAVSILVDICLDSSGQVFSTHRLHEALDRETVMTWAGGGQEQVAFGLLVEAARREAVLGLLLLASKDRELLTKLRSGSEEQRHAILTELSTGLRAQMDKTVGMIADAVVKEALQAALG